MTRFKELEARQATLDPDERQEFLALLKAEGQKPGQTFADLVRLVARTPSGEYDASLNGWFEMLMDKIVEHNGDHRALAELRNKALSYRGVWQSGDTYLRGEMTTHDGSLWHANRETTAKPGDGDAWSLAVKHGRDGRDR